MTTDGLTQLGHKSELPSEPNSAKIECMPWKYLVPACVRFTAPEFTSLCPVTGQPDFGRIVIDYVPRLWLIESKALKLFLGSFRNHGRFHEEVAVYIGDKLNMAANPLWIRVCAYFAPRGGIPIDIFWSLGKYPEGLVMPPIEAPEYRLR